MIMEENKGVKIFEINLQNFKIPTNKILLLTIIMRSKIIEIFEEILDRKWKNKFRPTPQDIEEWDSVATINIIVATEDEFGIKFKLKDVQEAKSVKDF